VLDCRALPNPGRLAQYAALTGQDEAVIAFLQNEPAVGDFLRHVFALIDQTVENYQSRNFTDLIVAFGCTGGQHRSVYFVERLAAAFEGRYQVQKRHREIRAAAAPGS